MPTTYTRKIMTNCTLCTN